MPKKRVFLQHLKIKTRLLLLMIIPGFFIVALSWIIAVDIYEHKMDFEKTLSSIKKTKALSRVIHHLQIERGYRVGALDGEGSDAREFKSNRELLNGAIKETLSIFERYKIKRQDITDILSLVKNMTDSPSLPNEDSTQIFDVYTEKIAQLVDYLRYIPASVLNLDNRNCMQAHAYLATAKEFLGQSRALIYATLIKGSLDEKSLIEINEYMRFYKLTTRQYDMLVPHLGYKIDDDFFKAIESIKEKRRDFDISASEWFKLSTQNIDRLHITEQKLFGEIDSIVKRESEGMRYKIYLIVLFFVFGALALFLSLRLIAKRILVSTNRLSRNYSSSQALLEQYKYAVDSAFIVSKTDKKGVITYVNDAFCDISGYSQDELLGKPHNVIRHPDMPKETFRDMWHTIKDLKKQWVGEIKNLNKNGESYWVQVVINPILDEDLDVVEYIGMRADITSQKQASEYFQNQLKISNNNFEESVHLAKEYEKAIDMSTILSRTDAQGNITYVNNRFLNISGYKKEELLGKNHRVISSKDTPKALHKELWKQILKGEVWEGIIEDKTKSGDSFWINTTIIPIKNSLGEIIEFMAIRSDITALVTKSKELDKTAKTDLLTGCGNRLRLVGDIKEFDNLSAAIFNLDDFREVNDLYGHEFGDLLIKSMAKKIYARLSNDEKIRFYRLQGDEFIALASDYERDDFVELAKTILAIIKEKFILQNREIHITGSCGISFEDKEHLLSSANMALKMAKESSSECVIYTSEISLDKKYENNIKWSNKLSDAIKQNRITTLYQPIVNNKNKTFEKYECLVRMIDEEGKLISPFFFLDIAKKTRQYFDITKIVIKSSFEAFKDYEREFSVNISINDILEPSVYEYIISMLGEYGIGERVVFEIVESEYIEKFDEVMGFIAEVKKYGCKIAIDDFGTGYSNFEYLIKLKADYLKIDGSLIRNISTNKEAHLVVTTITEFAKKLGMKTIAEFVEDEQIFEIVKEIGIDYSQGYYFSAPGGIEG